MRAVFVNHCHPDMDHVCATRVATFAEILARQGHRIVVLCETLSTDAEALSVSDHRAALASHDWTKPYVLACKPAAAPLLERLHDGRLPGGIRQAVVAAG